MSPALPIARRGEGIELAVKVTPKAGRSAVAGVVVDAAGAAWLAVKVAAPPEGGRANDAVLALLAKALDVPVSACRLVAGATARWKRLAIQGDPATLEWRAEVLIDQSRRRMPLEKG